MEHLWTLVVDGTDDPPAPRRDLEPLMHRKVMEGSRAYLKRPDGTRIEPDPDKVATPSFSPAPRSGNATGCDGCKGCRHRQHAEEGDWCYMFATSPEKLPCSQHDYYEPERSAMSATVRKHPGLLQMLLADMISEYETGP